MAIQIKHAYVVTGSDQGNGEVGKAEWNANLVATATGNTVFAFDGNGDPFETPLPSGILNREPDTQITGINPSISGTGFKYWTLTGNSTPTFASFANGDSMTISILDGSSYTIDWANVDKIIGTLPVLDDTDENIVVIWKSNNKVYLSVPGVAVTPA